MSFRKFNINDINDVDILMNCQQSNGSSEFIYIYFSLNEYGENSLKKMIDLIVSLKNKGYQLNVYIDAENLNFKVNELERFIDIDDIFSRNNIKLFFSGELNSSYTLSELLTAQIKLNEFIDLLNDSNASPYEKYLMIYEYVASMQYNENEKDATTSRDLIAVLNGQDIVCVGYASLLKHLCDAVGIKCLLQDLDVSFDNDKFEKHRNNLIYLKDDKYEIDGWYYVDACWDSLDKKSGFKKSYNFCHVPLSDIEKLKDTKILVTGTTSVFFNVDSKEEKIKKQIEMIENDQYISKYYNDIFGEELIDSFEVEANNKIYDYKLRADACDYIYARLKDKNIPADFYARYDLIPRYCSIPCLLSLILSSNYELFEEALDRMQYIVSKEYLSREINDYATRDLYFEISNLHNDDNNSIWKWDYVKNVYISCKKLKRLFGNELRAGKNIKLQTFKNALVSVYKLQGVEENIAIIMAEQTINRSEDLSEKLFEETAENCFRNSKLQQRKKEI